MIAAGFVLAMPLLAAPAWAQEFRVITLMSWNLENLFDTEDDPANPFDDTYLPKSVKNARPGHKAHCRQFNDSQNFVDECINLDWTPAKLTRKLQAVSDVIRAIAPQPDILIFPEIENPAILHWLNAEFLTGLGYATEIELDTTVTDLDRGIDVGILTRLPLQDAATAHRVDFGQQRDLCRATRDIIRAPLILPDSKVLQLFGVHLPSGGNPLICRDLAMRTLNAARNALPQDAIVVAGGDFNFPCNEAQDDLFSRLMSEGRWTVPPEVQKGCNEPGSNKFNNRRPNGSWFTWSFLDFFAVSDGLRAERPIQSGWFANLGSFRTAVVAPVQVEVATQGFVSPRRMNFENDTGISDHWPVLIDLLTR